MISERQTEGRTQKGLSSQTFLGLFKEPSSPVNIVERRMWPCQILCPALGKGGSGLPAILLGKKNWAFHGLLQRGKKKGQENWGAEGKRGERERESLRLGICRSPARRCAKRAASAHSVLPASGSARVLCPFLDCHPLAHLTHSQTGRRLPTVHPDPVHKAISNCFPTFGKRVTVPMCS